MTASGIVAYAGYVPRHRLERAAIAEAIGGGGGSGARSVASFDEDSTTMAVEASRRALRDAVPADLFFATTAPAYADKTNATAIHAALGLAREGFAADLGSSVRGAIAALRAAADRGGVAVMSDVRTGLPGSADERDGADAAAAFVFGSGPAVIAEVLAEASGTVEFLDRWREPGVLASRSWEDRFGASQYEPLVRDVAARCLQAAGLDAVDHVVVSSPHGRVARSAPKGLPGQAVSGPRETIGYAGAADAGLGLAAALDVSKPGETTLLVSAADGADALVVRATEAIAEHPSAAGFDEGTEPTRLVSYSDFLTWRGFLTREPPRRPQPERTAAPPSARSQEWKFGFVGSCCVRCGWIHLPPHRVCAGCGAVDAMQPAPLSGARASVATFTVDHLAFSPSPPVIDVVIDFDAGGRFLCQATDTADVEIGDQMEMTFRRLGTSDGIHNYFWKARPVIAQGAGEA